ncbi:unnamed protein product [Symbiodinium sp. KB8]|nr:unnamed protein product [Symbiodinium sp. KB8]
MYSVRDILSACDSDHLLPPHTIDRSFRNSTLALLEAMESAGQGPKPGSVSSLVLWVALQWDSSMVSLFILTSQMAMMCFSEMYGWAAFLTGCQHVVKLIRHLAAEVPGRMRDPGGWSEESIPTWVEAATERAIEVMLSSLWSLSSSLCIHLPNPYSAADRSACSAAWSCWTMHQRMAQMTAALTTWSWIVQLQLEMALLWTLSPPPEPRPSLPDLLVGMQPGELDGHEDIQGAAFSCLLRLAFPKTMLSKIYMVEVGVHQAALAARLLREHPQLQYLGIDPYRGYYEGRKSEEGPKRYGAPEHYRSSLRRLRQFGQRAHLCRSTSMQASKGPLHSCRSRWAAANLDAVFIDGEHDFASVDQDLRLWAPRVRPGGLVAGHDYRLPHALDLVQAVHRRRAALVGIYLLAGNFKWVRTVFGGGSLDGKEPERANFALGGAREIQADPKDPAAKKKQQTGPEIPKDTKESTARRKQSTGGFARPAEPPPQDLEPAGHDGANSKTACGYVHGLRF